MIETTHRETIDDHVLMAHTYAKSMGATDALDAAEATVNARRPDADPEYASAIRERVAYMFLMAPRQGAGEFFMMARDFESHMWAEYRQRQNG